MKEKSKYLEVSSFLDFFNCTIKNNSILIIEPNEFHQECLPGYTKYFIDLGYNVDVLMHDSGNDSFCLFPNNENIKLRTFQNINYLKNYAKNLSSIIKKYDFILLQSIYYPNRMLYYDLGIYEKNNSIFVDHELKYINLNYSKYFKEHRILTLGNISNGLQVNPHYFGNIKIKDKNNKTNFFLTSSFRRNYKLFVNVSERLKRENFDFNVVVVGRGKTFNAKSIPQFLSPNFIFKYNISYSKLYEIIENSDFIIIPLEPNNSYDILFKTTKATGSMQLVYGFLKPAIINQEFANFYNLNEKNSLIYTDSNLYDAMRNAILLSLKEYKYLQTNLHSTEEEIYQTSINNLKKVIHKK